MPDIEVLISLKNKINLLQINEGKILTIGKREILLVYTCCTITRESNSR